MSEKRDIDVSAEAGLIWKVADGVLRDVFQRTEYTDIIYPMVLIRRLECVLEEKIIEINDKFGSGMKKMNKSAADKFVTDKLVTSIGFANNTAHSLQDLKDRGETSIKKNFINYLNGFHSKKRKNEDVDQVQQIINNSGIRKHIDKLFKEKILYSLVEEFANINLHPTNVSNIKMGYIFEELVRMFSEQNNAEAGEHYTPREVIDLMVHMLDIDQRKLKNGELVTIYDPACGTGGMLTAGKEFIENNVNKDANVRLFGQEVNDKTWAICESDLMIKGEDARVVHGDTLTDDGFIGEKFDYMLSNPPYGKSWSKIQKKVMTASKGRFDIGQPRSSDGQLLFTLNMIAKMKSPKDGGSAIAIVHNGSPLFSGDAGSGESKIREYVIANDLLETIVALPTELFYNTGIATYVWIIRNNKPKERQGKIQLINANTPEFWEPMRPSLGNKRRRISAANVEKIVKLHKGFKNGKHSKIYDLDDFAYRKVFIELEELDERGNPLLESKDVTIAQNKLPEFAELSSDQVKALKDKNSAKPATLTCKLVPESDFIKTHKTPDTEITIHKTVSESTGKGGKKSLSLSLTAKINVPVTSKDSEIIPWKDDWEKWLGKNVEKKWTYLEEKKGYDIPFTREFYIYQPLRALNEVEAEFSGLEKENVQLVKELEL